MSAWPNPASAPVGKKMFIAGTFTDCFLKSLPLALVVGLLLNAQNLKKNVVLLWKAGVCAHAHTQTQTHTHPQHSQHHWVSVHNKRVRSMCLQILGLQEENDEKTGKSKV